MFNMKLTIEGRKSSSTKDPLVVIARAELHGRTEALYKACKIYEEKLRPKVPQRSEAEDRTGALRRSISRKKKAYKRGYTSWVGVGARSRRMVKTIGKGRAKRVNPAKYFHLWDGGRKAGIRVGKTAKSLSLGPGIVYRRVDITEAKGAQVMDGILKANEKAVSEMYRKLMQAEIERAVDKAGRL